MWKCISTILHFISITNHVSLNDCNFGYRNVSNNFLNCLPNLNCKKVYYLYIHVNSSYIGNSLEIENNRVELISRKF